MQQQQQQHHHHVSSTLDTGRIGHVVLHQQQQQAAATAVALAKWARVERSARAALKKASVHSVLALEMQALQLIEQVGEQVGLGWGCGGIACWMVGSAADSAGG